jgi:hypothetical protein
MHVWALWTRKLRARRSEKVNIQSPFKVKPVLKLFLAFFFSHYQNSMPMARSSSTM